MQTTTSMTVAVKSTGESEVSKGVFLMMVHLQKLVLTLNFFFSFPNRIQGKNNGLTLLED